MNLTITPEIFWNTFSDKLKSGINEDSNYLKYYYDPNYKKWTEFIETILILIGKDFNFKKEYREISKEYFRIDFCFFKVNPNDEYDWNLEVAIEHENSDKTWFDEFTKLTHINCGLKVLIAYHDYINDKQIDKKLNEDAKNYYLKRKYKQSPDNWLIIIGPSYKIRDKDFVAYKFDGDTFELLENKNILPIGSLDLKSDLFV